LAEKEKELKLEDAKLLSIEEKWISDKIQPGYLSKMVRKNY
jgi:hypothetical protein